MSNQMMFYQMMPVITTLVNWFTGNFQIVAVSVFLILVATIFVQNRQLQKVNKELERTISNARAYEDIVSDKEAHNRVLQLTIEELNQSKDSLIQQVNKIKKENKVKDKNLVQTQVINTEIKDTVQTVIKHKLLDFEEELKLNSLTTIIVSRQDSILTAKIDIKNQQILFVEDQKEYKRKYKNGFRRLLHFDWKKIRIRKYTIQNSNPLIKVTDTRVVEIKK